MFTTFNNLNGQIVHNELIKKTFFLQKFLLPVLQYCFKKTYLHRTQRRNRLDRFL